MKLIKWYIEQINENTSVKLAIRKHPSTWKIEIIANWDSGFQNTNCFSSIAETLAYLKGFYDAIPF